MPRLRLLPVVIAASAVAVPLYAAGVAGLYGPASAQQAAPQPAAAARPPAGRIEPGLTDLMAAGAGPGAPAAAPGGTACQPALVDTLAAERRALDARAAELEVMAAYLQAAERRAAEQVARLEQVRAEVAVLVDRRQAMAEADLNRLVAIYGNMKPKDAARLLNGTETDIVVSLLDRMEERRAAPILADMEPAKVNELTRALAVRRQWEGDRPPQQAGLAPPAGTPRM